MGLSAAGVCGGEAGRGSKFRCYCWVSSPHRFRRRGYVLASNEKNPMGLFRALLNPVRSWTAALKREVQLNLLLMRFPTLEVSRPSIWRYDTLRAIDIGQGISVGPFTQIIAYSRSPRSRVPGKLILADGAAVGAGCNLRAAGGTISIGARTAIAQNSVVVAANHRVEKDRLTISSEWDEDRTGVTIGSNCWIAANCVLLPGVTIGDNSVIAAGSVVTKSVPANEIWAGVPARFLKKIGEEGAAELVQPWPTLGPQLGFHPAGVNGAE